MDDAASVRVSESPGNLAHDTRCVGGREWTSRAKSIAECLSFDVAHDEEDEAVRLTNAMNRDDVRVRESGSCARLPHESLARCWDAREVQRENLDCNVAIQLHVAREVN